MEQKMTLADLATGLSRRASVPMRYSEAFVKSFFKILEDGLMHDNMVKVKGFGTFKLIGVEARESVNVNTGERFEIAGHTKVSFTPDATLRDAVNKPFVEFDTVILSDKTDTALMEATDDDVLAECVAESPAQDEALAAATQDEALKVVSAVMTTAEVPQGRKNEAAHDEAVHTEAAHDEAAHDEAAHDEAAHTEVTPDETTQCETVQEAVAQDVEKVVDEVEADESDDEGDDESRDEEPLDDALDEEELTQDEEAEDEEQETVTNLMEQDQDEMYHSNHTWHHVLWVTLLAFFFTSVGYCIDYYWRPFTLPEFNTAESVEQKAPKQSDAEGQVATAGKPKTEKPVQQADSALTGDSTQLASEADAPATVEQPAAAAADYPQLEGGDYVIVGVLANDTMKVGKMLSKMAIQYYGDKDLYQYICVMNGIENPDVVPLNMPLRIPKLQKK